MGMKPIPPAAVIGLTIEERKALEALAGSRKCEARMRDRARIVLLGCIWHRLPRGRARSWLHAGHRVEVAGALCQSANGGSE